ncbi:hypothetical protein M378DRAFT_66688 [Amanita muscaria Koide BX008]|uniref:Cytochrome P450 n=1 Tax=Amanita muscaria (strain Koide BX008) TaxID=946122 RepID=A0A0C2XN65_AMAMK|nr:hypothetical protein M378DRAFT_66688 [Amanita muscaria Koide BX008]
MVFVLPLSDPLRMLPGPDGARFQNHFRELMDPKCSADTHEEWVSEYGKTLRFHGFGKHDYRLLSFDFRVVSHVLTSSVYGKPWQTRSFLARLIGRGIFSMEGEEHRIQRRLIGPAFSPQTVKRVTPVVFQKAAELREKWTSLVSTTDVHERKDPLTGSECVTSIDVAHWISLAAFDVIGLAGFDYNFHALHDETEDVYLAYRRMFSIADKGPGARGLLELYFPILRKLLPTKDVRVTNGSLRTIKNAGKSLIARKKHEVLQAKKDGAQQKDILNLLIKANLSSDPSKSLSDAELLDQCSTFLLAGSDSVSLAIAWCIHLLSLHPDVQERVREELINFLGPCTSSCGELSSEASERCWEIIDSLPFLDAVVRETLRLCPPVHGTIRVATADDQIPVSEPIALRDGNFIPKGGYITIRKGSYVHIPIEGLNYSPEIWGPTAKQFNPDRWSSLPEKARSPHHPGLGNLMTFGFGPHSCLGFKFTIAEIKIFLATLIPNFVFTPVPDIQIGKFNAILTRPFILGQWDKGTRMPILVRPTKQK